MDPTVGMSRDVRAAVIVVVAMFFVVQLELFLLSLPRFDLLNDLLARRSGESMSESSRRS